MGLKFFSVGVIALTLAACSPEVEVEPEPTPLPITPEYNKVGEPTCPAGTELATTELGRTVCNPAE